MSVRNPRPTPYGCDRVVLRVSMIGLLCGRIVPGIFSAFVLGLICVVTQHPADPCNLYILAKGMTYGKCADAMNGLAQSSSEMAELVFVYGFIARLEGVFLIGLAASSVYSLMLPFHLAHTALLGPAVAMTGAVAVHASTLGFLPKPTSMLLGDVGKESSFQMLMGDFVFALLLWVGVFASKVASRTRSKAKTV